MHVERKNIEITIIIIIVILRVFICLIICQFVCLFACPLSLPAQPPPTVHLQPDMCRVRCARLGLVRAGPHYLYTHRQLGWLIPR